MTALAALRWPEVTAAGTLLVVPVGSLEQHGPHLPLDTDTRVAVALAERLAAARPGALVAPAVPYGASGEHAGFPGTLSIGTAALTTLLVELVRSAAATFDATVLVNGHGGNADALAGASAQLTAEGRRVLAWSPPASGDAHAGATETSLLLALAPELVAARQAQAGNLASLSQLWGRLRSEGVRAVAPNGVLGDPAGASAAAGARLLAAWAERLRAEVARWLG